MFTLCCRWGGERNRPLESARRIADAAIADLKEHKEGPATKRRRVEETNSGDDQEQGQGQADQVTSRKAEDPLLSCVGRVPSSQGSNDAPGTSTTFQTDIPEMGQSSESRDEIANKEGGKSYFDAEAVTEQDLGARNGEVTIVRAKIISGLAIAGKTVQVMLSMLRYSVIV